MIPSAIPIIHIRKRQNHVLPYQNQTPTWVIGCSLVFSLTSCSIDKHNCLEKFWFWFYWKITSCECIAKALPTEAKTENRTAKLSPFRTETETSHNNKTEQNKNPTSGTPLQSQYLTKRVPFLSNLPLTCKLMLCTCNIERNLYWLQFLSPCPSLPPYNTMVNQMTLL